MIFEKFVVSSLFLFLGSSQAKIDDVVFQSISISLSIFEVDDEAELSFQNGKVLSTNSTQDLFGVASSVCSVNLKDIKIEGVELEEGSILQVCIILFVLHQSFERESSVFSKIFLDFIFFPQSRYHTMF
jgi:hypothetical protein